MKKKILLLSLTIAFAFSGVLYAAGVKWNGYDTLKLYVSGKEVKATEPPIIVKGKQFIPVSALKKAGISVSGDSKSVKIELPKQKEPEPRIPYDQMVEISKSVGIVHAVFPDGTGKQGSGVAIENGVFITACHVACGASRLSITVDGKTYSTNGQTLFQNDQTDVYGVKIDAPSTIKIDTDTQKDGSRVYAVGYPKGQYRVTEGSIFGTLDLAGRVISNTAPLVGGNSGGALIDSEGELIGLTIISSNLTDKNLAVSMVDVLKELNK